MSTDAGQPAAPQKQPDPWHLPEILAVRVRPRRFDPPYRVTTAGVDREVREAIEVEIRVSEPFGIRALGPALWIGNVPLTVAENEGNVYRFFAFGPEVLKPNSPISVAWNSAGAPRKRTRHRYSPPSR